VKKALAAHKAGGALAATCLECQGAAEPEPEPEPAAAAAPPAPREGSAAAAESLRCTSCRTDKPPAEFSRKMLTRPKEKRRCKECVGAQQVRPLYDCRESPLLPSFSVPPSFCYRKTPSPNP